VQDLLGHAIIALTLAVHTRHGQEFAADYDDRVLSYCEEGSVGGS
jgi:hypothetical protein